MGCKCKALILKTSSTCFTVHAQLHASHHVTCLHLSGSQVLGKEGILHLPFRKTKRNIAAFILLQMSRLIYLKGDIESCCIWWSSCVFPLGVTFVVLSVMSHQLLDGLPLNLPHTFKTSQDKLSEVRCVRHLVFMTRPSASAVFRVYCRSPNVCVC